MKYFLELSILVLLILSPIKSEDNGGEEEKSRSKKVLNMFSVVRFANEVCSSTSNLNGTCYTASECENRGGMSSGSCASGYGVCCTFTIGCGATSAENCTYFQSTGLTAGACRVKICPCSDNICQLRLDFSTFVISGPSTATISTFKITGTKKASPATQCLTDQFTVTNPGGDAPPIICGTNSGEHVYVDSASECNELAFNLAQNTGTGAPTVRNWNIKITQYSCDYDNLAPDGCTQYFFGATSDIVKTFNFDGGHHLADQDQSICVRREVNICRICWATTNINDFELSGKTGADGMAVVTSGCCGYGADGMKTNGYDCVMIPSATKSMPAIAGTPDDLKLPYGICGGKFGSVAGANAKTICSRRVPFSIRFLSDHYDFVEQAANSEGVKQPNGFRLTYILSPCT